jgi:RNA polymerase sigma-70 factor, ECF subfamily
MLAKPSNKSDAKQDNLLEQTDEDLMQYYALGNFHAFECLYLRHKGPLYRYFVRQLHGSSGVAEDLYQEVWSQVIKHAKQYSVKAKFTTWLYTLARNKLIDHIRQRKTQDQVFDDTLCVGSGFEEQHLEEQKSSDEYPVEQAQQATLLSAEAGYTQTLSAQALKRCVEGLTRQQKDCFLLKEEAGLTTEVIAEIVACNYEACKSRLRKAYTQLRECLDHKLGKGVWE